MSTIRQEQIQGRLIAEVNDIVRRDLKDPRLGFITITGAKISRDLKYAKVFITVLGDEESEKASMKALQKCAGFIGGEFARRQRLRIAPEIMFETDESIGRANRILGILHTIDEEAKLKASEPSIIETTGDQPAND